MCDSQHTIVSDVSLHNKLSLEQMGLDHREEKHFVK